MEPADVIAVRATWALVCGDCLDPQTGMASLGEKSVAHVITDPPYSRDLYTRMRTNRGAGFRSYGQRYSSTEFVNQAALASLAIGAIDDILDDVAREVKRVTARWIVVFHDIEIAPRWRAGMGDSYLRTGIWLKPDAMPQVTGDRPAQAFEAMTIAHRAGRKHWNAGGKQGVWICGTCKGYDRPDHPCPKPLSLMQALVRDFTDPGDLILDPFAGSGTTGVAALSMGRRFIGWEKDPKYHDIACRRLARTHEQLDLLARTA